MLLSEFLPLGALWRLLSACEKHFVLFHFSSLHCFASLYCQCGSRQCIYFVIDWLSGNCFRMMMIYFNEWYLGKEQTDSGLWRASALMNEGRAVFFYSLLYYGLTSSNLGL